MLSSRQFDIANLNGSVGKSQSGCSHEKHVEKVSVFRKQNDRPSNSTRKNAQDVIVIEDDEEGGEVENRGAFVEVDYSGEDLDGDGDSRRYSSSSDWDSSDDSSAAATSEVSGSSDDEGDCLVMECGPCRPRLAHGLFDSGERSFSGNSSDCEIIAEQEWEEAAHRKRMGNVSNASRHTSESEASTRVSDPANIANGNQTIHSGPVSTVALMDVKERTELSVVVDQQDKTPDPRPEDAATLAGQDASLLGNFAQNLGDDAISLNQGGERDAVHKVFDDASSVLPSKAQMLLRVINSHVEESHGLANPMLVTHTEQREAAEAVANSCTEPRQAAEAELKSKEHSYTEQRHAAEAVANPMTDGHTEQKQVADGLANAISEGHVVIDRERLKETDEFRHADEEEWARRQQELQRQAQEAQREKKRRKVEAERKVEMESRQRQRLEEIRQSHQKEEQNLGYKEQVRGQVRAELEGVAATCKDMATLLRRLGVPVDGGILPTTQQVSAAYKKALLRFHPDRMAKSEPLHQVEAEETFKLISRMKSTLQPVSLRMFS